MGRPCKLCSSSIKSDVDQEILNGQSFDWLETYCLDRGLTISHTSIKRHAESHVEGYNLRSKTGYNYDATDTPRNQTMDEATLKPILIKPIKVKGTDDLINTAKTGLAEILANQIAIVKAKQKSFMEGKSKYPSDELRGLKNIMDCFEIITGKEKHKRAGNNIFDLDEALQFSTESSLHNVELLLKKFNDDSL
jgi:hypothetical protein